MEVTILLEALEIPLQLLLTFYRLLYQQGAGLSTRYCLVPLPLFDS
jgi:hypothetical protein